MWVLNLSSWSVNLSIGLQLPSQVGAGSTASFPTCDDLPSHASQGRCRVHVPSLAPPLPGCLHRLRLRRLGLVSAAQLLPSAEPDRCVRPCVVLPPPCRAGRC